MLAKYKHHPSFVSADALKALCEPLSQLGITYFCHSHVKQQKLLSGIALNPEFTRVYIEKQHYNSDVFNVELPSREHYVLWDGIEADESSAAIDEDFMHFDMGHGFSIIRSNPDQTLDCYDFATSLSNQQMNEKYYSHLNVLKAFINHFHEKVANHKDLNLAYDLTFNLNAAPVSQTTDAFEPVMQHLQGDRFYIDSKTYLTRREYETLYWAAQGKTYDEIAIILSITPRTVAEHMKKCKQKLNCQTNTQLGRCWHLLVQPLKNTL